MNYETLRIESRNELGLGFLWAFLDRDGQFLHDRLARTRLVDTRAAPGPG